MNKIKITGSNKYEENINIIKKFYCDCEKNENNEETYKLSNSINRIILLENTTANRLDALYLSGQILKDKNTVLFLVPSSTSDTNFEPVKNLIQPIINNLVEKGEIYTLCSQEIIDEVLSWYKEDLTVYGQKSLTELLHSDCISTTDENGETSVTLGCSNNTSDGYCYEEYIELLISVILDTTYEEVTATTTDENGNTVTEVVGTITYSDLLEAKLSELDEEDLYKKVEEFFKNILGKENSVNKSDINYYVGQLLGITVVTVQNQYYGGSVKVTKVDSTDKNKYLSAGFKLYRYNGEVKEYLKINNADKLMANGEITVENLEYTTNIKEATEIFTATTDGTFEITRLKKDTYYLIETTSPDEEYVLEYQNLEPQTVDLNNNREVEITISNTPYAKLEGYVWEDINSGKENTRNGLYDEGADKLVEGIVVTLYDSNGVVAEIKTEANGKYSFGYEINLSRIEEYYVEFTYDGLTYTSVAVNTGETNGSKAKEVADSRKELNSKFEEIDFDKTSGVKDGTINTDIIATTKEAQYTLPYPTENNTITNVNLGIVEREQPDLELKEELVSAKVIVNGYEHTYTYDSKYEGEMYSKLSAKFKNKELGVYTRDIYPSDIALATENADKLAIYVTYKIKLINESNTLYGIVNKVVNYYDSNYTISEVVGGSYEPDNKYGVDEYGYSRMFITSSEKINPQESKEITLTFKVNTLNTINKLLNNEDVILNSISEINSYTTYDSNGNIYAGLDKDSTPGNSNPDEDDLDYARAFKLQISDKERTITGTVWKDEDTDSTDGTTIGNGKLDDSERKIQGVKVEVIDNDNKLVNSYKIENVTVGEDGKYKYETEKAGNANAISDENGSYTITGLIPGEYKLKYTYTDGTTKIVDANGNIDISVKNYKSTIMNENSASKVANFSTDKKWIYKDTEKYNDAVDNLETRYKKIDSSNITNRSTNNNSEGSTLQMDAYTPGFALGVELIEGNSSPAYQKNEEKGIWEKIDYSTVNNIDFGIIERPKQNAEISKEITYIKLVLSNGQVLIEGNPSTKEATITYVKTGLDGTVPMEIDFELLPATIELKYTITVTDTSEVDYEYATVNINNNEITYNGGYYYYGDETYGEKTKTIQINKIVDYLPSELIYDTENNKNNWDTTSADALSNNGLISNEVKDAVSSGYTILVTEDEVFDGLTRGSSKSVDLYATTTITSTAQDIKVVNYTEIIDYNSTTFITGSDGKISTPGNLIPGESNTYEADSDSVEYIVTPPTGENKDYTTYYILGVSVLLILGLGIVLIKKKVINK